MKTRVLKAIIFVSAIVMSIPAHAWDWVGEAPRAGEKYYIYNAALGGFLKGGSDKLTDKNGASLWQLTIGDRDLSRVTIATADANGYRITCELSADMILGLGAFSTSKTDGAEELTLTKVSNYNGSYTISYIGQSVNIGNYYFTFNRKYVATGDYVIGYSLGSPNERSYWKFISEKEFAIDHSKSNVVRDGGVVTAYGNVTHLVINNFLNSNVNAPYAHTLYMNLTSVPSKEITSPNPNLIIFAREGQVTNTKNVVTDHVCSNLVLSNSTYPFAINEWFTATNAEYDMTAVAGGKFGTLMLPFDASELSNSACEIYVVSADINATGGDIYGDKKQILQANKPALVTAASKFSASNVVVGVTSSAHSGGFLTGVYQQITAPKGSYVLQNHNDLDDNVNNDDNSDVTGVAFYRVGNNASPKVNPFRAYINAPTGTEVKAFRVHLGDETTDLAEIMGASEHNDVVYDLSGRRVNKATRGIYIVNGKKIIKK